MEIKSTSIGHELNNIMIAGDVITYTSFMASKKAGWWQNVHTGEDYVAIVRDPENRFGKALVAEKLALIHSEVSEALEGARKNKMDEHLTHRKSIEVELADAVIRIGDLCGALGLDLGGAIAEKMEYNASRADHKIENRAAEGGKAF